MTEFKSIQIEIQRDTSGHTTCSTGVASTKTCQLMLARNWGFTQVCGWTHTDIERRSNVGTLIPVDGCPLWNDKQ